MEQTAKKPVYAGYLSNIPNFWLDQAQIEAKAKDFSHFYKIGCANWKMKGLEDAYSFLFGKLKAVPDGYFTEELLKALLAEIADFYTDVESMGEGDTVPETFLTVMDLVASVYHMAEARILKSQILPK